jgi:hypothetical protein
MIWVLNLNVILSLIYLSFGMALGGWIAAMRRGEAVTIIPKKMESNGHYGCKWS